MLTFNDINNEDIIIQIQKIQNYLDRFPTFEDIALFFKDEQTIYYKVFSKNEGKFTIHRKSRNDELINSQNASDFYFEFQLSATDSNGVFPFMSGISKSLHWHIDTNFNLTSQQAVVQEYQHNENHNRFLQIYGRFDNDLNILNIEMVKTVEGQNYDRISSKTEFMTLREENLLFKIQYYHFTYPEQFYELFNGYILGPIKKQLTYEEIESRLSILDALNY